MPQTKERDEQDVFALDGVTASAIVFAASRAVTVMTFTPGCSELRTTRLTS